ncbi:MAG: substrate-binding domain-containing protein [Thermomicrobiales bacterium]
MRPTLCRLSMILAFAFLFAMGSAVAAAQDQPSGPTDVILATTTSTQDSGLLDVLTPLFEERTGYHLKPIAVGSGAAMKLGEEGEADVLLVHSPSDEAAFMAAGFGTDRHLVMVNDFVLLGPADDPAAVAEQGALAAMTAISASTATFVSRGDESGTHKLELSLWEAAGVTPEGGWYVESGTGMGDTLNLANEREGYTIADRGTYLALRDRLDLVVLVEGDPLLLNPYHVIAVNPDRYDTINDVGARAFIEFLLDPETQAVIGEFGLEEFGQPLFTPCADNACGVAPATPTATPNG